VKLRAEHLTKRYGAVTAVDGLSFAVEDGETFALIGPNGSGKTTTLRLLLGLARPDAGRVAVGASARPPHDPQARRALGYVPQRVEFPAGRTVREVLAYFAELKELEPGAVDAVLRRTGLQALAERTASTLSGGTTQRLSLAQALLGDPELLVLDEPTASLDPQATWEFRGLIEQLRRDGVTIVLCSHLLAEVERVADRVLILNEGRPAALERLADLRARQLAATSLAVELTGDAEPARAALARAGFTACVSGPRSLRVEAADGRAIAALDALRDTGLEVRSFELHRPTLEDLFLSVVRVDAA
jgi:Cu-processing system ATP-binding protein